MSYPDEDDEQLEIEFTEEADIRCDNCKHWWAMMNRYDGTCKRDGARVAPSYKCGFWDGSEEDDWYFT